LCFNACFFIFRFPLSAFRFPLSAFRFPLSAFRFPLVFFCRAAIKRFYLAGSSRWDDWLLDTILSIFLLNKNFIVLVCVLLNKTYR
jgi:hypothetical protein